MSVVAWKDGLMAADSRAYGGSYCASPGSKWKIHRLADGSLIGLVSSIVGASEYVLEWVRGGMDTAARPTGAVAGFILIRPSGLLFLGDAKEGGAVHVSGPIKSKCHAIGSGAEFAIGAMHAGLSAEGAVRVACKLDNHSGLPVRSLRL